MTANQIWSYGCHLMLIFVSVSLELAGRRQADPHLREADRSHSQSLSLRYPNAGRCTPMMLRTQTNSASMPMMSLISSKKVRVSHGSLHPPLLCGHKSWLCSADTRDLLSMSCLLQPHVIAQVNISNLLLSQTSRVKQDSSIVVRWGKYPLLLRGFKRQKCDAKNHYCMRRRVTGKSISTRERQQEKRKTHMIWIGSVKKALALNFQSSEQGC